MLEKNLTEAVDPDSPWARDKLKRKAVADYLTPVIASIRQPFVVSLHSPYGTGKTFFLECWKHDLEQQGFKTVLFNAWETDFSQDALSAFMASMKCQLGGDDEGTKKNFIELAKSASGFARAKLLPVLVKAAARKLVGSEGMEEIAEGLGQFGVDESDLASLLSSSAVEALAAQEAAEASMDDFKQLLKKIAADLVVVKLGEGEELTDEQQGKQKLIIFVDELDRCRPIYAVEVLECIKHLFAVEGIVFVLAVDDEQMKSAIASTYGLRLDGEGYLRKFIDWQYNIPEAEPYQYAAFLCDRFSLNELTVYGSDDTIHSGLPFIAKGMAIIGKAFGLSLRQIENALTRINLVSRNLPQGQSPYAFAMGLLAAMQIACPKELEKCLSEYEQAVTFLERLNEKLKAKGIDLDYWNGWSQNYFLCVFADHETQQRFSDELNDLNSKFDTLVNNQSREDEKIKKIAAEIEQLDQKLRFLQSFPLSGFQIRTLAELVNDRLSGTLKFM